MLNEHLQQKMFLVGHSITAADITALAHLLRYFVWLQIFYYNQFSNP